MTAGVLGAVADAEDVHLSRDVIHAVEDKVGITDDGKHANSGMLSGAAAVGVASKPLDCLA